MHYCISIAQFLHDPALVCSLLSNCRNPKVSNNSCTVSPLLQTYKVMILGVAYFLYAYARPYKATLVNIIEMALLAYLGVFLMLKQDLQQQTVLNIQLDETSVDSCGKLVLPPIGPAWVVLGVLYFLPVTVLLFMLGRWLYSRVVHVLRYVEAYKHLCVHLKLHLVIRYTVRMCVCILLCFSPYTIRKKLCKEAQKVHLSGPTDSAHSTTNFTDVTEATIELSQGRSSSADKLILLS